MSSSPVAYQDTIEIPILFQDSGKIFIMAAMLILIKIIRPHHRPDITLDNSRLESRKVDFIQRPVTYDDIRRVPVKFLIVKRIMFDTCSHALLLDTLDVRYDHFGRQTWVLTHIFKISSTERCPVDVAARSQQNILLSITGLLSDRDTIEMRQLRIPCGRKSRQRRISRT